ncbi:uncharacterized protein LOC129602096 [Paramacrobiotus metropolitanus]|uniref:uncharacterized protein LOC129602096 n=1 Tax=Paramacrobiotus metropolitanus TaxID=2943436 RepID=UPI00244650EC|nr:uncharacterized protein LOC129602096 [Paramacrobiotus metropolitanus]
MLVYGDDVYTWNSVDVLVDGQLQYGRVINVAEGGLIIDFHCAGQRAQFVEYGRIFQCRDSHAVVFDFRSKIYRTSEGREPVYDTDAQVLLRASREAPWILYPGKIGDYGCDESLVVEVRLPSGMVRELLPCQQIRVPLSEEDWAQRLIVEKQFVIRYCPIPTACRLKNSSLLEIFQGSLHMQYHARITAVFSGAVLYMNRGAGNPLHADTLERLCATAQLGVDYMNSPRLPFLEMQVLHRISDPLDGLPLPAELLLEVFRARDCIGRVRCRRVCALWNSLLTTDAYFPDVRVSGREDDYRAHGLPLGVVLPSHWLVTGLMKCVNNRTQTVVITGLRFRLCRRIPKLIRRLHRLKTLVFYRCEFGQYENPEYINVTIEHMLNMQLFATCRRVVWKKCDVYDYHLQAFVARQAIDVQPDGGLEMQLWDLFEKNLVLKKPVDLQALVEWVDTVAMYDRTLLDEIFEVLWNYQSADPRGDAVRCTRRERLAKFSEEMDVSLLTTMTAAVLHEGIARLH